MTDMSPTKSTVICVFCGAAQGTNTLHLEAARSLARELHKRGMHLVYGGGTVGLMGELAKTLVSLSGPQAVHGVIPQALIQVEEGYRDKSESDQTTTSAAVARPARKIERTVAEMGSSEFGQVTVVPDMHTRKKLMAQKVFEGGPGSGFIAMAGGLGTLEELMEMATWNQLGIHRSGVVLLNINGYWNTALAWVRNAVQEGFLSEENARILVEAKDGSDALEELARYRVSADRLGLSWSEGSSSFSELN